MKIEYRIVDAEGDECNLCRFKLFTQIPVAIKSVEFRSDADPEGEGQVMIITLEYLHGGDR